MESQAIVITYQLVFKRINIISLNYTFIKFECTIMQNKNFDISANNLTHVMYIPVHQQL